MSPSASAGADVRCACCQFSRVGRETISSRARDVGALQPFIIRPSMVHRPLTYIPVCIGNLLAPCLFNQCLPRLQSIGL